MNRLLVVLENIPEHDRKTRRLLGIEEEKERRQKLWHPACTISTLLLLTHQHPLSS